MSAAGLFVTGTDTEVGKTILSAALIAAMRAAGIAVVAHKPAVSGLDEPATGWPADHELLGSLCGMAPEQVSPLRYGPAVSPHLAARLAGRLVDEDVVIAAAQAACGWDLQVADRVSELSPPTAEEVATLRGWDPRGWFLRA